MRNGCPQLLERLVAAGEIDVEASAAHFDVSAATIRRDLDHLADQQLLTRTHGGAVPNSTSYDLPLRYKSIVRSDAKTRIATAAVGMLWPGCTVSLNGGHDHGRGRPGDPRRRGPAQRDHRGDQRVEHRRPS